MNRNELVASIMLEAADLLRESAGRNGAMRKFYNVHEKDARDKYEKADKEYEQATEEYDKEGSFEKRKMFRNKIDKLDEERKNNSKLSFKSRLYNNEYDNARKWLDTLSYGARVSRGQLEFPDTCIDHGAYFARVNKSAKNGPKNPELHKKINDRALKESIDALYEAAYTADSLNEASNYIEKAELLEAVLTEGLVDKYGSSKKSIKNKLKAMLDGRLNNVFIDTEDDLRKFLNKYGDDIDEIANTNRADLVKSGKFTLGKLCTIAITILTILSGVVAGALASAIGGVAFIIPLISIVIMIVDLIWASVDDSNVTKAANYLSTIKKKASIDVNKITDEKLKRQYRVLISKIDEIEDMIKTKKEQEAINRDKEKTSAMVYNAYFK